MTGGSPSDEDDRDASGVLAQRGQQLDVILVAGDDPHVEVGCAGVGQSSDDGIDTRWSRIDAGADRRLTERTRGVPELLVDVGDFDELEESPHMKILRHVPGQDALREHRCGNDQVRRLLSEHPQAGAAALIDRCETCDSAGVEDDDQPAALRALPL